MTALILAWMFSSVTSLFLPLKAGARTSSNVLKDFSILDYFIINSYILGQSITESETECSEEYLDGISSALTFSRPSASAARQTQTAESIPPDNPIIPFLNPVFTK